MIIFSLEHWCEFTNYNSYTMNTLTKSTGVVATDFEKGVASSESGVFTREICGVLQISWKFEWISVSVNIERPSLEEVLSNCNEEICVC